MKQVVPRKRVNSVWDVMSYFIYHPKTRMSQVFTDEDRVILGASIRRLLDRGMSVTDMRRAIDRFYMTEYAESPRPALYFTKTAVQEGHVKDMTFLAKVDDIGKFISYGFERMEGMTLPWAQTYDDVIKRECLDSPSRMHDIIEEYHGAL